MENYYTHSPVDLIICPEDHFIVFKENLSDREIEILKPYIDSEEYQSMVGEYDDHYLLAKIYEKLGFPDEAIAVEYIKASWNTKDKHCRMYIQKALELLASVVEFCEEVDVGESCIYSAFLMTELYRRLGEFEKAEQSIEKTKEILNSMNEAIFSLLDCEKHFISLRDTARHFRRECRELKRGKDKTEKE